MEFRNLRAFVEVVRQSGFTAAARALNSTQSAVSKSVRQIEDEIGAPLLDRLAHGPRLTEAGEIVYRRALRLLAERDDLTAELDALRGLKRGVLRLGLPQLGSGVVFAPLFTRFRQLYPEIEIRLIEHGSARLEEILRMGDIDFAASLMPIAEDFEWIEVRREPMMALLPRQHPLAARSKLKITDLRDSPFILFESGFALNRIIIGACRRSGFEPKIVARSSQIDFIVELANAGLGVAFLPDMLDERRPAGGPVGIALDEPETDWRLALVWRRGAYLSDAARAWLALLQQAHKA
ncbi:LysR substrate-binding domain-containing protein [Rhodoblastus sp.]|uniref:LysR family transcriptional regulator n=1 Tax=Rhodoblastus sp. TaxID=1962975 RepID=UPI0035B49CB2